MEDKTVPIIDGPDKWLLISSFVDKKFVEFDIGGKFLGGVIEKIQHADDESLHIFVFTIVFIDTKEKRIATEGCYDTQTKKGFFKKITT